MQLTRTRNNYCAYLLGYSFCHIVHYLSSFVNLAKYTGREIKAGGRVCFNVIILASDMMVFGPYWHEWGFYVATVQYHPLDFSDRPLNYLSFSSDHLIYLGLLHWIYCLVFFQNWNVKSSVMYAVALCCESFTDPPKAASSWSLDRARNK